MIDTPRRQRAPYGSKALRLAIAATELYEFTQAQIAKSAGVDITSTDFENAKRERGILEQGRVIVECGKARKGGGRGADQRLVTLYTFRNHDEYSKLCDWISRFKSYGDTATYSEETPLSTKDNKETVAEIEDRIRDIFIYLATTVDKGEEKAIWAKRCLRYVGEWASASGIPTSNHARVSGPLAVLMVNRYRLLLFRLQYVLAESGALVSTAEPSRNNAPQFIALLRTLVDYCESLGKEVQFVEFSGIIDLGVAILHEIYMATQRQIEFEMMAGGLSEIWAAGQWEVVDRMIEKLVGDANSNLIEKLHVYWVGLYRGNERPTHSLPQLLSRMESQEAQKKTSALQTLLNMDRSNSAENLLSLLEYIRLYPK